MRRGTPILRKNNNIDFILPVGGGSTIDCAKVIAAGFFYNGDPWDLVVRKGQDRESAAHRCGAYPGSHRLRDELSGCDYEQGNQRENSG